MTKTSSKTTRTTRAKAARIRCVDGEPVLELREFVTERELARLQEAVKASRWGYVDAEREGVNIRATWGDCQLYWPYGFNVTAGAKGVSIYHGIDDMGRDRAVQMALDMLTMTAGMHGLTAAEREKLGEIVAAIPLFPRDAERAAAAGAAQAEATG